MKNQSLSPLLVTALLCLPQPSFAARDLPYLGFDISETKTALQQDFGGRLFANKSTPQYNFFVGYFVNDFLGFEIGYQHKTQKDRYPFVPAGAVEFNVNNFAGIQSYNFNTKKKMHAFNLNVTSKFEFNEMFSVNPVLGLSYFNTKLNSKVLTVDGAQATAQDQSDYNFNFSSKKLIPRLGLRFQAAFSENIGARVSLLWENTARMKPTTKRNIAPNTTLTAKFKNTISFGAGLYYQF